jgi:hypothetical protein
MRYGHRSVIQRVVIAGLGVCCLVSLMGCEAFIRKFTRKPKNKEFDAEEMVLVPEEYKGPQMTKEELYRQRLLFWKSWQEELINALASSHSHKKRMTCINEAIKNLINARKLLNQQKQQKLDEHLNKMKNLQEEISRDTYGGNTANIRQKAERLKRNILSEFSYRYIKDDLI